MVLSRSELWTAAQRQVAGRLADLQQQVAALDDAQANDTKSSAGDKFETSREMLQQQRDQLEAQLAVQRAHAIDLEQAAQRDPSLVVGFGSVVELASGQTLLIACGLGKVTHSECPKLACISLDSPLGQALRGKVAGDQVEFRGQAFEVLSVQ